MNLSKTLLKCCSEEQDSKFLLENLIDLLIELYQLNNFNSSYAIYVGIKHSIEVEENGKALL